LERALAIESEALGTVQFQESSDFGLLVPVIAAGRAEVKVPGPAFFTPLLVVRPAVEDAFLEWFKGEKPHLRCRLVWGGQKKSRISAEVEPLRHTVREKDGHKFDGFVLEVTDWERMP
jgi:hypothetical protein